MITFFEDHLRKHRIQTRNNGLLLLSQHYQLLSRKNGARSRTRYRKLGFPYHALTVIFREANARIRVHIAAHERNREVCISVTTCWDNGTGDKLTNELKASG